MVSSPRHSPFPTWADLGASLGRIRVTVRTLPHDIVCLRASSLLTRRVGMSASLYRVGGLLVDTGFSHARGPLLDALAAHRLTAIACTHHHEDHTGNAAALSRAHGGCPIYLREPSVRWSEGVGELLPYRQLYWGPVPEYSPEPLPDEIGDERPLEVVPAPGHSASHVVFHERRTGVVFTGDLLVSAGASALMRHEDPYALVDSLRRVADLEPRLLLSGHGLVLEAPAERLRIKADRVEAAAEKVRRLHARGLDEAEIVRQVFRGHRVRERWGRWHTQGEFSRPNFVRAALRHAPPVGAATLR